MNSNLERKLSCKYKQLAVETGILILNVSLRCLKEVKTMDMILGKCKFPYSFLPYFQLHVLLVHIGIASYEAIPMCIYNIYVF